MIAIVSIVSAPGQSQGAILRVMGANELCDRSIRALDGKLLSRTLRARLDAGYWQIAFIQQAELDQNGSLIPVNVFVGKLLSLKRTIAINGTSTRLPVGATPGSIQSPHLFPKGQCQREAEARSYGPAIGRLKKVSGFQLSGSHKLR